MRTGECGCDVGPGVGVSVYEWSFNVGGSFKMRVCGSVGWCYVLCVCCVYV